MFVYRLCFWKVCETGGGGDIFEPQDIQLRVGTEEKSKQPKLNALLVKEHISNQYQISLRVKLL